MGGLEQKSWAQWFGRDPRSFSSTSKELSGERRLELSIPMGEKVPTDFLSVRNTYSVTMKRKKIPENSGAEFSKIYFY